MQIIAAGASILLVQEQQVQAYSATSSQLLWEKSLSGKLQSIVSDTHNNAIYLSTQEGGKNRAITLLALESTQGKELWSTLLPEPSEQAEILDSQQGRLLISLCERERGNTCINKRLYMFEAQQGKILWKSESRTIDTISINPRGSSIVFQLF